MKIKVAIDKADLSAALDGMGDQLVAAVGNATSDALHMVEGMAKTNAPIRTGRLRGSIRVTGPGGGAGGWSGKVGPHTVYANIQEFGGVIVPKRVRFLHWVDASGSHFARKVTIPAHPYMRPAVGEARPLIGKLYEAAVLRVIED